jgi:hypothetical protein
MFSKIVDRINPLTVITVDEAKDHLNIVDFYDDDSYIESLILAASDIAEKYTKRLYSSCRIKIQVDPVASSFFLPYNPIQSIETVLSGETVITHSFNSFSERMTISKIPKDADPVIVTYIAGYVTPPEIVKHACRIIVADLYNVRESHVDVKMTTVMFNALRILN